MATAEVCRRHGISTATYYRWKSKFGGLEVSVARRLRALEEENARLKKLLAEAMLNNAALKDLAAKKWWRPARSVRVDRGLSAGAMRRCCAAGSPAGAGGGAPPVRLSAPRLYAGP
jgi:putative transposase